MLSRAALLSGQQSRPLLALAARTTTTAPIANAAQGDEKKGELWQRPVRQEPGKVRLGFIPEEWFSFFYKKTGVTGPYTLGITLGTYLFSKEIYVLEHEYYSGLSLAIFWIVLVKKFGPPLAKYLDKEIDDYERSWSENRENEKQGLKDLIDNERNNQWSLEGQTTLVQAKRENIGLQLEAAYRLRLQEAYQQVRRRLDYQVEKQNIERRIAQKNLADWVIRHVTSAITPDQEKQNIDKCIADLSALAK